MESIFIRRRLNGLANASKCSVCGEINFRLDMIQGIKALICNECGHIDFFTENSNANQDSGHRTILKGQDT
jgi:DNA-directed RNA polymerase subunit RPC12/RpoP